VKSSATPPDDTSATGQGRSSVDSGRECGAAGVNLITGAPQTRA